jgi:uncharacterized protein YkwD
LRKLAATALAVPVLAVLFVPRALRRTVAARVGLAIGLGAMLGLGGIGAAPPRDTTARPPSALGPLPAAAFTTTVEVGRSPDSPVTIAFNVPMDPRSVAAALRIEPAVEVDIDWNAAGTHVTLSPLKSWKPGMLHTVTVAAGALDANGTPLVAPARASFLVRAATDARLAATDLTGERVRVDSSFVISFDRPVDPGTVMSAFTITPQVSGTFTLSDRLGPATVLADRPGATTGLTFTPDELLETDTIYTVTFVGKVLDLDRAPLGDPPSLAVRTTIAPSVVRFRPVDGSKDMTRGGDVSVRFTQPMDRRATAAAFSVEVEDEAVAGSIRWAEGDTVLVFDPDKDFGYERTIVLAVSDAARSKTGAPLAGAVTARFTTQEKPAPRPLPVRTPVRARPISSGGGAVGGGTWASVERYYLKLMNCTRTGGWVTSRGGCSSPGGRNVAPLQLSAGISSKVARPYARLLATRGLCSHFIGGNPGDRLRRAGYSSYRWAENIGCRSGGAAAAVLGSHLFFQSEKPYNGGHYRNLMDARFNRVGIGVWVSGGRVRLVVDFYHP